MNTHKEHYKLYKHKKQWVTALVMTAGAVVMLVGTGTTAKADATSQTEESVTEVSQPNTSTTTAQSIQPAEVANTTGADKSTPTSAATKTPTEATQDTMTTESAQTSHADSTSVNQSAAPSAVQTTQSDVVKDQTTPMTNPIEAGELPSVKSMTTKQVSPVTFAAQPTGLPDAGAGLAATAPTWSYTLSQRLIFPYLGQPLSVNDINGYMTVRIGTMLGTDAPARAAFQNITFSGSDLIFIDSTGHPVAAPTEPSPNDFYLGLSQTGLEKFEQALGNPDATLKQVAFTGAKVDFVNVTYVPTSKGVTTNSDGSSTLSLNVAIQLQPMTPSQQTVISTPADFNVTLSVKNPDGSVTLLNGASAQTVTLKASYSNTDASISIPKGYTFSEIQPASQALGTTNPIKVILTAPQKTQYMVGVQGHVSRLADGTAQDPVPVDNYQLYFPSGSFDYTLQPGDLQYYTSDNYQYTTTNGSTYTTWDIIPLEGGAPTTEFDQPNGTLGSYFVGLSQQGLDNLAAKFPDSTFKPMTQISMYGSYTIINQNKLNLGTSGLDNTHDGADNVKSTNLSVENPLDHDVSITVNLVKLDATTGGTTPLLDKNGKQVTTTVTLKAGQTTVDVPVLIPTGYVLSADQPSITVNPTDTNVTYNEQVNPVAVLPIATVTDLDGTVHQIGQFSSDLGHYGTMYDASKLQNNQALATLAAQTVKVPAGYHLQATVEPTKELSVENGNVTPAQLTDSDGHPILYTTTAVMFTLVPDGATNPTNPGGTTGTGNNSGSTVTSTGNGSTTSGNTGTSTSTTIAKKGTVLYATKTIYLYKNATFKTNQRQAKFAKKARIDRPMFVVLGTAKSANGTLRYHVKDVNKGSKTYGKTGYITANAKFVTPVYYASKPTKVTVIAKGGVKAYKTASLTGKVKAYKQGTVLTVKKIVSHNLTTRFVLSDGTYITANKKLVISGTYKTPKAVTAKHAVNLYKSANLTGMLKHYAKGHVFKVKGYAYSNATTYTKGSTLRYHVADGYITGNPKFVK